MELVLISGRSGSGKSTALNALEDLGYNCIDNLPVSLLPALARELTAGHLGQRAAVCIDARNAMRALQEFPQILQALPEQIETDLVFLDALDDTLYQRFSETRRKHPVTGDNTPLIEAIRKERDLLDPVLNHAHLIIDTTGLSVYELRDQIKTRVAGTSQQEIALQIMSFGYKHGVPFDADLVYDVRCLPNPYWDPGLRKFSGLDKPVQKFLAQHRDVDRMINDIHGFLVNWLPAYRANNRSYLTLAIGCTGGQHRSVYITQQLAARFQSSRQSTQVRHREMKSGPS